MSIRSRIECRLQAKAERLLAAAKPRQIGTMHRSAPDWKPKPPPY